ncbi:hypothetical protein B0H10DRAFT_510549 [Mycena sp. CBHHK59/15]|nr:hypothetical protein B0H10DRAFT_510549 [Mycena sp. CBHHK59/15]
MNVVPASGLLRPASVRSAARSCPAQARSPRPRASSSPQTTRTRRRAHRLGGELAGRAVLHGEFRAPAPAVVFAVLATNSGSAAGVRASAEIKMSLTGRANCTAGALVQTDTRWVSTKGVITDGWQLSDFDGSAWPESVSEVGYALRYRDCRGAFLSGQCMNEAAGGGLSRFFLTYVFSLNSNTTPCFLTFLPTSCDVHGQFLTLCMRSST